MMNTPTVPEAYPQNGEMGCFTACVAFTHNYLASEQIQPDTVDVAVGREPDGWVNVFECYQWLMRQEHRLDIYYPQFNGDVTMPYLNGELSFEELAKAYVVQFGEDDYDATKDTLREWMEEHYKPNYHSAKAGLNNFAQSGLYVEHREPEPSPDLVQKLLKLGGAIITYQVSANNNGQTHAITVFPHPNSGDAMVYIPDEEEYGGSELRIATAADLDDIQYDEEFLVVGQRTPLAQ
jgi:hypothetical protein